MTTSTSAPPLNDQQSEGAQRSDASVATPAHGGRRAVVIGILMAAAFIAILVGIVYLLLNNPSLAANIRDIVIIITALVLAVMSIATSLLLIILLYRLQALTQLLRSELVPILTDTQKAVRTVYSTTVFVSRNIAQPTIKAAGFAAGIQQMARAIGRKFKDK